MWQGNSEVFSFGEELPPSLLRKAFNVRLHVQHINDRDSQVLPCLCCGSERRIGIVSNDF
jgi:hypothetical protein